MRTLLAAFIMLVSSTAFAQGTPVGGAAEPLRNNADCGTIKAVGEGLGDMFYGIGVMVLGISTTLTPDVAVVSDYDASGTWGQLSWPLVYAFAPTTAKEVFPRRCRDDLVIESKASRVIVEPMLRMGSVDGEFAARFHLRSGYRFVYRTLESVVGYGLGLGSTLDFAPQFEASLSPELIVSFGECCAPGYVTLIVRYDRYFDSKRNVGTVQLGWTFH